MGVPDMENPVDLFALWLNDARDCKEIADATAMALATADAGGVPDVRMVLLKGADEQGFTFYTNLGSVKAAQLMENPHAALCFHWAPLKRQVRVRGPIVPVTPEEADAYFSSRPKQSQIGAWASKQSQHLEGRFALEQRVAKFAAQYALFEVPRPEFWSGFRLLPSRIEFWMDQPFRLHDRVEYTRETPATAWTRQRLYP
jgi:pyridoxamine 5'-phosphate oxidase